MAEPQFWWCGWETPDDLPQEDWAEAWPPGMAGWCTGHGDYYRTWTGAVWAETPEEAMELVYSCYGGSADQIRSRWEPKPKGTELDPSDRFPGMGDLKAPDA